ncbi:MAG: SH3 beta-barrel fold-containing protein [Legionella sp.]|uniref:SH3 beta-barrel fold-containing protein n=1 Tax=Legionella sp. TaxID=459 RepID=UPI0028427D5D|nr:SH3 beta-barrel fold-containing protein [Legionella sp.]
MPVIDKETFKADLRQNIVQVVFTKVDGTNRIMNCTLSPRLIPPAPVLTEEEQAKKAAKKPRKENPDVVAVFDTDLQSWRSMRYDSIISVQLPYTS